MKIEIDTNTIPEDKILVIRKTDTGYSTSIEDQPELSNSTIADNIIADIQKIKNKHPDRFKDIANKILTQIDELRK